MEPEVTFALLRIEREVKYLQSQMNETFQRMSALYDEMALIHEENRTKRW